MVAVKRWNDSDTYYRQDNNASEFIMARLLDKDKYLETCGPTSAVMAIDAIGGNLQIKAPGKFTIQQEDYLFLWFHDRRNFDAMEAIRPETAPSKTDYWGNQIPQYYPQAIKDCFGVNASFEWGAEKEQLIGDLQNGKAVVLNLKEPGHFVTLVAYDEGKDIFIYNDPWPDNYWPSALRGTSGFNRRIDSFELTRNLKSFRVLVG